MIQIKIVCDICGEEFGKNLRKPETVKAKWKDPETGETHRERYQVHRKCLRVLITAVENAKKLNLE